MRGVWVCLAADNGGSKHWSVQRNCHCQLLGSQLSIDQYYAIAIAIAIVGSHFGCICCGVPVVVLGGNDVMVAIILIEDVSTLLILIKDC